MGIDGLDTRALTLHLRNSGAMRVFISTEDPDPLSCVAKARKVPSMVGQDLASVVSTRLPYRWCNNEILRPIADPEKALTQKIWNHRDRLRSVVAFDFGMKYNILRCLEQSGCEVIVVPAATSADTIRDMAPDGLFFIKRPRLAIPRNPWITRFRRSGTFWDFGPSSASAWGFRFLALPWAGKPIS